MIKITAVILAAGLGTRMKSETPKVLHNIGSSTLLGKTIGTLKKCDYDNIIAVVGYKSDIVEKYFEGDIRFVRQPELLGSGDALAHAVDYLPKGEGIVLVTCGDAPLFTKETYKKIVKQHLKGKTACTILTSLVEDPTDYGRIVRGENKEILKIIEEKDARIEEKKIREINAGVYCFSSKDLRENIREIELNEKKKEFYLTDIIDILVRKKRKISSCSIQENEAVGVNTRGDLQKVHKIMYARKITELMELGVTVIDPNTTYIDEDASVGQDSIIYPNTVIEGDVIIGKGCKIGPFARIRPNSKIKDKAEIGNFVEINRSIIGENTRVKHHTYLGDAIVGKNVNIGAGTITANYDGVNKYQTIIEDGAFIGVGVILIAPIKIGKKAIVGAGSVVTKNKNVKDGETVIGVPAHLHVSSRA